MKLCGRLALLLGGALTLAFYLMSLAAATPAGNARYLIEMNIALPAIAYPLWTTSAALAQRGRVSRRTPWLRWAGLGLLSLTLLGGVVATYRASGAARASYRADQTFIHDLERLGVRHIYTEYWTCAKVAFLSQERITCDGLNPTLGQGFNRYPPYVAATAADPQAAYVFPASSPQAVGPSPSRR